MRLGDVADLVNGYAFDSKHFNVSTEGMPLIRIRDVIRGFTETYTTEPYKEEYVIRKGDLLIGMDGEFNIAPWNSNDALLNQRVCKIASRSSAILNQYLYYFLPKALKSIEDATAFVTVKHLSSKKINDIQIPLPPLPVQQQIANVLDRASALIEKRKAQIEKLDLLVKSQFIEMFGDPVTNPMGWEIEKFSSLGEINRGVSKHRPRNDPKLLGGPYPLVQTGDVANAGLYISSYNSTYSEQGLAQSKIWGKGTLCITIAANIAKTSILTFDACFPDSVVGFLPNCKTNVFFMYYWFAFFQKILEEQAPESAQKNINLKILYDLNVICPPDFIQNKFVDFVQKVELQKALFQQSLAKLEQNYKSLMQKCFRGEIF